MKLVVQGIEEIELTDPQGLCNPKVYAGAVLAGQPKHPLPSPGYFPIPTQNNAPIIAIPHIPSIYTRHHQAGDDEQTGAKWGIGGPMIQSAESETRSK